MTSAFAFIMNGFSPLRWLPKTWEEILWRSHEETESRGSQDAIGRPCRIASELRAGTYARVPGSLILGLLILSGFTRSLPIGRFHEPQALMELLSSCQTISRHGNSFLSQGGEYK